MYKYSSPNIDIYGTTDHGSFANNEVSIIGITTGAIIEQLPEHQQVPERNKIAYRSIRFQESKIQYKPSNSISNNTHKRIPYNPFEGDISFDPFNFNSFTTQIARTNPKKSSESNSWKSSETSNITYIPSLTTRHTTQNHNNNRPPMYSLYNELTSYPAMNDGHAAQTAKTGNDVIIKLCDILSNYSPSIDFSVMDSNQYEIRGNVFMITAAATTTITNQVFFKISVFESIKTGQIMFEIRRENGDCLSFHKFQNDIAKAFAHYNNNNNNNDNNDVCKIKQFNI